MKQMRRLACLTALLIAAPVFPCTIFKLTRNGATLVGNNEDYSDPAARVWFLPPKANMHGRAYFGFANGFAQGGVNDAGLFFDWVASVPSKDAKVGTPFTGWAASPSRLDYHGRLSEKILEEATTVEEAIQVYRRYNEKGFGYARTMLVDRTGASAIIGWKDGDLDIVRPEGAYQVMGVGARAVEPILKDMETASIDGFRRALEAAVQGGRYPTQYSNLYDLGRGEVLVYDFRNQRGPFVFKLAEEFRKGSHYYDLPGLPGQPPQVDNKTATPIKLEPAVAQRLYASYAGKYRSNSGLVVTVTHRDGRLFEQSEGWLPACELAPVSERRFVAQCLNAAIEFGEDSLKIELGQITQTATRLR